MLLKVEKVVIRKIKVDELVFKLLEGKYTYR